MYYSPKLKAWYTDAMRETGTFRYLKWVAKGRKIDRDYAIFPRSLWDNPVLKAEKDLKYCFIGALAFNEKTRAARQWVIDFTRTRFDDDCYLQFTDRNVKIGYEPLGDFDFTLKREGFVPKQVPKKERNQFDRDYYATMARARFVLCPAGDAPWSMRFYESLMCRAIPIVETAEHSYRSDREAELGYRFYLPGDDHEYREDWVEENTRIFLAHHTI